MIQKLKKNDKGFTLVELIVVIAILGVLAAVLVPQYIQYVEKARLGVDNNYVAEVAHNAAIQAATIDGANTGIYTITFTASTGSYTVAAGTGGTSTVASSLDTAIKAITPITAFKSATYKAAAPGVLTMTAGVVTGVPAQ